MIIIPAIDIRDKKVVRLLKGDFDKETVYSDSPAETAAIWQEAGAKMLHIVDLDGALTGSPKNIAGIREIAASVGIPIEVGGGIRTLTDIETMINLGVARVILSTAACENEALLKTAADKFGERIAVGLDVKKGKMMTRGWIKSSHLNALEVADKVKKLGINTVIYTDIDSDGTLSGVKLQDIRNFLMNTDLKVIASGGVTTLDDLKELKKLEPLGLEGAIIGKALYDKRITLEEALKI
ncbi:MAG: 1-(5-phosphoribosyl)-5-[(5-phosphoribosylamino)methylideneamino]imidazole-4-carboxamide isomerase [Candidatus Omnitrophica bacterium]|nr:1-(5-phosphoribosyl)-5-[(5-phosphoribosylamino)methylideneamino]imidazole-4-carboxamide isomerase [Candidatus Omnitrophota bacterium]